MTMMREPSMIMLMVLSAVLATPAAAQTGNILSDNYSIMVPEKGSKQKQKVSKREQPEPWLAPKYRSPSGTVQQVHIPKSKIVNPPSATDPGYVYVPQTGRTFQNLPTPGQVRGPRLLRIALCVAPTKLVSMARPATPEAPIWVLAFNNGSPSGFALSATRRILNGIWKISGGAAREFDVMAMSAFGTKRTSCVTIIEAEFTRFARELKYTLMPG